MEDDTSLTGARPIPGFLQLEEQRGFPVTLRVDNVPEFLATEFTDWAVASGMKIQYIQAERPNQKAFIARFNRTLLEEVLGLYPFDNLEQVRKGSHRLQGFYNSTWPHESLGDLSLLDCAVRARNSTFEVSS